MEVKIFVDVLFIINFIIDYILLSITSFFAKKSPSIFKMCLAASVGALFSATVFFTKINPVFSFFCTVLVAFIMIFIAFGTKKVKTLLRDVSIFYLVVISASGVGFALIFSGNSGTFAVNNGVFYANIDAYTLLLIFVVSVTLIHTATGYIKKQKIKSSYLYNVTIEKNGRTVNDTALFDSGNFLTDPISQKSVIIAEWQTVRPLFAESKITETIVNHPEEFLYIGCRGLGDVCGLYAFKPDSVSSDEIDFREQILVAITETSLDKEGTYRMILPNTSGIQNRQERI